MMKTNKFWMGTLAMVAMLMIACEEENQTQTPIFPTEVVSHTANVGEEVSVTFTANADWQLSSDALWCKVDGFFLDTRGKAGSHSITFVVSAEGQSVDESKANITLRMGDESKVIATIARVGITGAIVLGNDSVDYVHNQTVTIGSEGTLTLAIKSTTFDLNNLYITTNVDWLTVNREGTVIALSVNEEYLKYTQTNTSDSICFSDRGNPMMRLNVQYAGMDAEKVILSPTTQWGLTVSADGMTYRKPALDGTSNEEATPIQVTIASLNDAYTFYYADYDVSVGCTVIEEIDSWIVVEDDAKGNACISFKENADVSRTAYLFVLPDALSKALPDVAAVASFLFDVGTGKAELKPEYEQYLIAEFTQESALAGNFHLIDGPTFEYLDIDLETDEMYVGFAQENGVSPNNVLKAELEFAHPYIFNPMLPIELWDPSIGNGGISVFNISTYEYAVEGEDYTIEPTLMEAEGDYMLLQFRSYIDSDYIVFFVDGQKVYHKALIVTTKY